MKTKIMLLMSAIIMSVSSCAQILTVNGTVCDEQKQALLGVYVSVEGTQNSTITDTDGKYEIKVKKGDVLCFSYIGYETTKVKVKNSTKIDVALKESKEMLEEVVIVGYGVNKEIYKMSESECDEIAYSPVANSIAVADNYYDEEYSHQAENRFKNPKEEPLSTFSVDVDAASYGNMRRFINQGQMPTPDAIRVEELINYFSYNLPKPTGNDPVKITTEVGQCPWNKGNRLVRIGLKAKEIPSDNLPAANLVFLIDVSGSMNDPLKLELVKSSLKLLVNNLRNKDRVAIVVYAGAAGIVLPSTSGSDKQKIKDALGSLTAGGSTAGGAGIQLAYKTAKKSFISGGNNRVILCTDGDFNVGVSSNEGLESLIETERKSGIFLTVLGYGMGNYKDEKMQTLAQKGNGNNAYIDNIQEANKVLVNEFGSTLYTVAKDVKLQIEFNPTYVQAYRLVGYETRMLNKEDFNDDTKDAGEMGAGHTVTAFYEIIPTGVKSNLIKTVDDLKYQKNTNKTDISISTSSPEMLTVKLRYKLPDGNTSQKIELPLIDNKTNIVSDDFRFAAAVSMFGQLLKNSDFKGNANYDNVLSLAKNALGKDEQGYRHEFVRMVEAVKGLE